MPAWPETRYSLLARLAVTDDEVAWGDFQAMYQSAIYRYARSYKLQEADALEIVQEVMIAVHRAIKDWKFSGRVGSFRAWLAETTRRLTLQSLKSRSRKDRAVGGESDLFEFIPEELGSNSEADRIDDYRWQFMCAAAIVEQQVAPTTWKAFWLATVEGRFIRRRSSYRKMPCSSKDS
jgi:RNA polymerase sigma-70 factor, ECF subfamily